MIEGQNEEPVQKEEVKTDIFKHTFVDAGDLNADDEISENNVY
jgi:hypothetical protein